MREHNTEYSPFSVAMCVYGGDNANWFDTAISSVIKQTVKPSQISLVVDGPIPDEIRTVIEKYTQTCFEEAINFTVSWLEINQGHGTARRCSLEKSTYDIIALMDSDDICVPDRFENELKTMNATNADIVGGNIAEFIGDITHVVANRNVPENDKDIRLYMKKRCPMNQMTVMMKKESAMRAGGYIDWYCNEDYFLWLRMAEIGCVFANTGTVLVNVRVGKDMYKRRGGEKYFQSELRLQKYMLRKKIISRQMYATNVIKRFIIQQILPNNIRGWIFKKFARSQITK